MADPVLVVVFLRGGADGLSLVAPTGDADYIAARPAELRVERSEGFPLKDAIADAGFAFHGRAKSLSELYSAGELAVVHATGLTDATRSHFDAEDRMERAAPGAGVSAGGWLARWLEAAKPEGILPALAVGAAAPDSLRGSGAIAVARDLSALRLAPGHYFAGAMRTLLEQRLGQDKLLGAPLGRVLTLSREIEAKVAVTADGALVPYQSAQSYPAENPAAGQLRTVAQILKLGLGLRVATVDFGGWDTHVDQREAVPRLIGQLSEALSAFWRDLGPERDRVTVVVMSEFGRRLRANESLGTDHGHGNVMLLLGAGVRGGRMAGVWPGLASDALDAGADLAITTDYRHVLAEVLGGPLRFSNAATLFPGFLPRPLGLVA